MATGTRLDSTHGATGITADCSAIALAWPATTLQATHAWLAALNTQLKRQLKSRGEQDATRLFGPEWVDYLCQGYPKPRPDLLRPLGTGLYQPGNDMSSGERLALQRELLRWVRHNHV